MSSITFNSVLLSSLLATAHALIPVELPAVPSDLDTNQWVPYTTLEPIPIASTSTPTAVASADVQILPVLDANILPELKRQVTGLDAAAASTVVSQMSPVTTYYAQSMISGSAVEVPIVYTQTFPLTYEPWPSPTSGEIGLGTITGKIGVVKSKRSLPTQLPLGLEGDVAEPHGEEKASNDQQGDGDLGHGHALLKKLKKAGKEIQEEAMALLNKQKKPALLNAEHLEKDDKSPLSPAGPFKAENNGVVALEKEQKKPSTQAGANTDTDANAASDAAVQTSTSDAGVLKAGTLAVLAAAAAGVASVCLSSL